MADTTGTIGWIDMTVDDAETVRDFYKAVVGWGHENVSMGDYADFSMTTPCGEAVSGICHARGSNAGLAGGRFCVIRDPAGSTAALYQP
jgi:predicted enzyme related to lactoylglutathione lyase